MQDNKNQNPLDENPTTDENTVEENAASEQEENEVTTEPETEETKAEEPETEEDTKEEPETEEDTSEEPEEEAKEEPETEKNVPEESEASEPDAPQEEHQWTGEPTFTYTQKEMKNDIPRWTPYDENYNTVSEPEKAKKHWVIPLVIVLAIMVMGIIAGVVIGIGRLNALVNQERPAIEIPETTKPEPSQNTDPIISNDTTTGNNSGSGYQITDVSSVVDEVMPAVVSITSRALVDTGGFGDYWDFFFGGNSGSSSQGEKEEVDASFGSGTIISKNDKELLILTSYHVVEDSSSLYVTFHDGKSVDGYIKSQSEEDDIAVVAVPLSDLSDGTMSDIAIAKLAAKPAKVGEGAIVIGNALGYGMSVTSGIVSATNREINVEGRTLTVLQTDAAINSGNSGGCVLNKNGEIIGISEAKIIVSHVEGMCYAIQISSNTDLIQRLLNENNNEGKKAEEETETQADGQGTQGAYLGIRGRDIDRDSAYSYGKPQGIYVAGVVAGSGAEAAGVKQGDIIVGLDNVSFDTMAELQEQLASHKPGDKVNLILMRENNGDYVQEKVEVTLTETIS